MTDENLEKVEKKSPLAPKSFPDMVSVAGVEMGAMAAGLRYKNRPDLLLMSFTPETQVAGVFTTSKTPGAPVDWSKNALLASGGQARALVVNAGNANAFTGRQGYKTTEQVAEAVAKILDCQPCEVMQASTGVIGEPLNAQPIIRGVKSMEHGLSSSMWVDAAKAIMTTDTFPKAASARTTIAESEITISAIAKGSGMIAPDMATMLGFVYTNANISSGCLQALLKEYTEISFNAITVDSDTSTSDMVLAFATGVRGNKVQITDPNDPALRFFKHALKTVMIDLSHQIVRDGEGATKFIQIDISGAENAQAAKKIAMSVANSPLVKTAVAGEDPNWGRLIMAVGKSGEAVDRDKIDLWIGDQQVAQNGAVTRRYSEEKAAHHMKGDFIKLHINVGIRHDDKSGKARVWTCDLTHQYIAINADYRS